jgi:hypothetical protein
MKSRVVFSSASDEWSTPEAVYSALDREFQFDFDPCPLGTAMDGRAKLFCRWWGKRAFVNPPYSDIRKFLERWHEPELAVYLLPARTDTVWFHEIVLPNAQEIRFIRGRLKFGNAENGAPFPSMIIVFRNPSV